MTKAHISRLDFLKKTAGQQVQRFGKCAESADMFWLNALLQYDPIPLDREIIIGLRFYFPNIDFTEE